MENNKKIYIAVAVVVLIAVGAWVAWPLFRTPGPSVVDQKIEAIEKRLDVLVKRIEKKEVSVKYEIKQKQEEIKKEVGSLPPDGVCDELNRELSVFRGVEGGAGGVASE
jgi:predicted negative regulator of RcsB-dependent stress response